MSVNRGGASSATAATISVLCAVLVLCFEGENLVGCSPHCGFPCQWVRF